MKLSEFYSRKDVQKAIIEHAKDKEVSVQYVRSTASGEVFNSSREAAQPIKLTIGEQKANPCVENALVGMKPSEIKTVTIPAAERYGPRDETMIRDFPKEEFPEELELIKGEQLRLPPQDGQIPPTEIAPIRLPDRPWSDVRPVLWMTHQWR